MVDRKSVLDMTADYEGKFVADAARAKPGRRAQYDSAAEAAALIIVRPHRGQTHEKSAATTAKRADQKNVDDGDGKLSASVDSMSNPDPDSTSDSSSAQDDKQEDSHPSSQKDSESAQEEPVEASQEEAAEASDDEPAEAPVTRRQQRRRRGLTSSEDDRSASPNRLRSGFKNCPPKFSRDTSLRSTMRRLRSAQYNGAPAPKTR